MPEPIDLPDSSEAARLAAGPAGGLFVISAPSGAGKSSLANAAMARLADMGLKAALSVSYTTRAPRPGERDGEHYHFVDEADFLRRIAEGDFFEHAEVFDRRYGTGRATTEALMARGCHVLLDIDWQGARQVRALAPQASCIFILPPSIETLEQRLRGRGQDSDATIHRRMIAAQQEIAHYDEYDFIIVNDDFQRATDELVALIVAQTLRRDGQAKRHRQLIDSLLRV